MKNAIAAASVLSLFATSHAQYRPQMTVKLFDIGANSSSMVPAGISESGDFFGMNFRRGNIVDGYAARRRGDALETLSRINSWARSEMILGIDPNGRMYGRSAERDLDGLSRTEDWYMDAGSSVARPLGFEYVSMNRFGVVIGNRGADSIVFKNDTAQVAYRHPGSTTSVVGISDDGTISGRDTASLGRPGQWIIRNGVLVPLPGLAGNTGHYGMTPSGRLFGDTFGPFGGIVGYTYTPGGSVRYAQFPAILNDRTFFDRDLPYVVGSDRNNFVYAQFGGTTELMSRLVVDDSGGGLRGRIISMNAAGQVLVQENGTTFRVITPVPEPATMTALAVGALALVRKLRKA